MVKFLAGFRAALERRKMTKRIRKEAGLAKRAAALKVQAENLEERKRLTEQIEAQQERISKAKDKGREERMDAAAQKELAKQKRISEVRTSQLKRATLEAKIVKQRAQQIKAKREIAGVGIGKVKGELRQFKKRARQFKARPIPRVRPVATPLRQAPFQPPSRSVGSALMDFGSSRKVQVPKPRIPKPANVGGALMDFGAPRKKLKQKPSRLGTFRVL